MAFKKRFVPKKKMIVKRKKTSLVKRVARSASYPLLRTTIRKLRYVASFTLDPSTAVVASKFFSANSLYAPEGSFGGHQPYGFDQLMALYNHYEVLQSSLKFTFSDTYSDQPIVLFSRLDADGNLSSSNINVLMEQPDIKFKMVNPVNNINRTIVQKWTQSKFFGKSKSGADSLTGDAGNSPVDQTFFIVGLGCTDASVNIGILRFTVIIDYVARFYEPRELSPS